MIINVERKIVVPFILAEVGKVGIGDTFRSVGTNKVDIGKAVTSLFSTADQGIVIQGVVMERDVLKGVLVVRNEGSALGLMVNEDEIIIKAVDSLALDQAI